MLSCALIKDKKVLNLGTWDNISCCKMQWQASRTCVSGYAECLVAGHQWGRGGFITDLRGHPKQSSEAERGIKKRKDPNSL